MNLLFICSRNQWRSPTAENIFRSQNNSTKSAGTAASARIKVNADYLSWADLIFVMEKKHQQILLEKFNSVLNDKKIIVLDIADEYGYMDDELIEILKNAVEPFVHKT